MISLRKAYISLCFIVAIALMVHHYIICGRFWDVDQFFHHEVVEIGFIGGGLALIIDSLITKIREKSGY